MAAASTKPPSDPVKTVEGMFNGSVTRIAYAMRDPLNYAQSTKAILAETAKKFQDALDDCEIQILDAKWYLEHQLALNKARREAKAKEDSAASAKRKREAIQNAQDKAQEAQSENAPKRVRTQEPEDSAQAQPTSQSQAQQQPPQASKTSNDPPTQAPAKATDKEKLPATKPSDKPKVSVTTDSKTAQPAAIRAMASKPQGKLPETTQHPQSTMTQTTADEAPRVMSQDTPAAGNEDFNFVSMFGDPSGDVMDGTGNDMNFDLNLGDGFDADTSNLTVQDSSLNSLLPGLESYANQAGDDSGFSMPGNANMGANVGTDAGGSGPAAAASGNSNQQQQQTNVNDFSLPALGPNEFDDFLNSNDINFDGDINLNDDSMMNMENMDDVDFDSMFN